MPKQKHVIYFLLPTIIALLIGGFFLTAFSKSQIHLFINAHHTPAADWFFKYITFLGEGWWFLLGIPALIFVSWRAAIQLALSGLLTGLVTALFKQVLFSGEPRPIKYFEASEPLYLIAGAEHNLWNSFPSGHTLAAFALYFTLALLAKNKGFSLFCFVLAVLVGYSRMYLSQHFLVDVVAGAGLGVVVATISYVIATKMKSEKLSGNLLSLLRK